MDHDCDRQTEGRTDGWTEWPLAVERSDSVRRVINMLDV